MFYQCYSFTNDQFQNIVMWLSCWTNGPHIHIFLKKYDVLIGAFLYLKESVTFFFGQYIYDDVDLHLLAISHISNQLCFSTQQLELDFKLGCILNAHLFLFLIGWGITPNQIVLRLLMVCAMLVLG